MNMPGKLREDLFRIYGNRNPLDFLEDVRVETNPDSQEEVLVCTLRVPSTMKKFARSNQLRQPPHRDDVMDAVRYAQALVCDARKMVSEALSSVPEPKTVFFNDTHTTIVWSDGEKTTVGTGPDVQFDEYGGFCAAFVKRFFGSSRRAEKFLESVKVVQKKKIKKNKEDK